MSTVRDTQRQSFAENSRRALTNAPLQRALTIATGKATGARQAAVTNVGVENWEEFRERAHAIKEHTINNLDFYLEKFSAKVERAGGNVCWAGTAEEACRYVVDLAYRHGIKEIVK